MPLRQMFFNYDLSNTNDLNECGQVASTGNAFSKHTLSCWAKIVKTEKVQNDSNKNKTATITATCIQRKASEGKQKLGTRRSHMQCPTGRCWASLEGQKMT